LSKNDNIDLNIDMASVLEKVNVPIPLIEIMKIPSSRDKVKRFLSIQDDSKDPLVLLQAMHYDQSEEEHAPFFISLVVNDLLLHICMLDSRDYANVMSLKVMSQLELNIKIHCINACGIHSKYIKVRSVIKDLKVCLVIYLEVSLPMDVIVIDVPDAWGMLLSRKWVTTLGGSLQIDFSFETIPIGDGIYDILYNHLVTRNCVEDPSNRDDWSEKIFEGKDICDEPY
jgi:hypothetical protein